MKLNITEDLYNYLLHYGIREAPILKKIGEYTKNLTTSQMMVDTSQAQFMAVLAKIMGAKKYLEVGVFTGYSVTNMALSMGRDSLIYALDNSAAHMNIAIDFFTQAGINKQIVPMVNDALISLEDLCNTQDEHSNYPHLESFDLAFIDANKDDYIAYYDYCYKLVRAGGVILIDNVLMRGKVLLNQEEVTKGVQQIHKLNERLRDDKSIALSMLGIGDGLSIILKL